MSAVLRHSRGAAIDGKRLNGCQNGQLAEMTQWRFSDRKRQAGRRSLHCQAVLALTRSVKVMQNSRMRPKASGLGPLSLILLMSLVLAGCAGPALDDYQSTGPDLVPSQFFKIGRASCRERV